MDTPTLNATPREITGKQVKQLRKNGQLPGVVYGREFASRAITMDTKEYTQVFRSAGTSTLVNLVINGDKPVKVLLHEPVVHPAKPMTMHADFYAVKMNEKVQTEIPLHFIGESEAVDTLEGTLNTHLDALNVECFPDKLVSAIEVDIASLKTFDDMIHVGDIKLPEGIEVLDDAETVVVNITPPISEEELEALDEAPTGEEADQAAMEALEVTAEKKEDEASEE